MSEAARGDKDDPFTCSKCGGPTKENGRWHPDLGTIYGYELGLGDATCGKRIAPERKAHKVHPSGKTLIWAGPGPAPETEGESRGETVAAYREALQEIATRPTVERNPDGDDQAAETMQLLARETLAAHGELRPAMPNMPEAELRVRKPAHTEQQGEEEARGEADDEAFMEAWGSLKTYTLHAYSERYSPSIRHDGPNVRTYDADAVDALLVRLRPAFQEASDTPEVVERPETCPTCGSEDPRFRFATWFPRCPDPFHTPEDTEEAPSRVEEQDHNILGDAIHPDTRDYVATNLLAHLDLMPNSGDWHGMLKAWAEHNSTGKIRPNRAPAQPDTKGEGQAVFVSALDEKDHELLRDLANASPEASIIDLLVTEHAELLARVNRAPASPQPVASEEDREVIRHLLRDGGNGVPLTAAGPLIRILTDSEALAQYAKERGE